MSGYRLGSAFLLLARSMAGASPVISKVSPLCNLSAGIERNISVTFDPSAGLLDSELKDPRNWQFSLWSPDHKRTDLKIVASILVVDQGLVSLRLSGAVPMDWDHITAQYSGSVGASTSSIALSHLSCGAGQGGGPVVSAAKGKDDADIYISGIWVPVLSGPTKYTIDSKIALKFARKRPESWFYFAGSVNTDSSKRVDPDSFDWRLAWQYTGSGLHPITDLGGGMEFDRTGSVVDLLVAPRWTWAFAHTCSKFYVPLVERCADKPEDPITPAVAWELDILAGVEAGRELKNMLRFSDRSFLSTGSIFRAVPGARFYLNLLKVSPLKQISFESDYDARLLTRQEILLETRGISGDPVPMLRKGPRHWVKNVATLKFNDFVGVDFSHEYGALPPAFTFVDHKFTVSLVLQLRQNRALRY